MFKINKLDVNVWKVVMLIVSIVLIITGSANWKIILFIVLWNIDVMVEYTPYTAFWNKDK